MVTGQIHGDTKYAKASVLILLSIVILKMFLHVFAIDKSFDLHRDEYLHLDVANHLAAGYSSVPPFISWIAYLIKLLGNSVFWVKFFPAAFGALTIICSWKIAVALGGKLFASSLTAFALLFSVLFRINILFQPNSFEIFFWTIAFLFIVKYIQTHQPKWLMYLSLAIAFGFLNKYSIAFLVTAVFMAFAGSKERILFANKYFYIALAITLLLISPNIYWQWKNNFPVIHHMKELAETQLVHIKRTEFLKEQMLFFFQAIFILIAAAVGFIFYNPFKPYRIIGLSFVFCLTILCLLKAKPYYAFPLYPVMIAFGSVYLESILTTGWRKSLRPLCFVFILLFFYPYAIRLPIVSAETMMSNTIFNEKEHTWEDGIKHPISQDYADMLGWQELAYKANIALHQFPKDQYNLIITDNYGQAGAINYYAKQSAVSFNADYINWFNLSKKINNVVFVQEAKNEPITQNKLSKLFKNVQLFDSLTTPNSRERGTRIYILENADSSINVIFQEVIHNRKNNP